MPDPTLVILILLFIAVAVAAPRLGGVAIYRQWRTRREQEQIEDALKLLFDAQQENRSAGMRTLMGVLHLSENQALRLTNHLQTQGLIEIRKSSLRLTTEGERLALHLVRAHRLWERYLADEAGMPLARIHKEAHRREHGMTPEQIEAMETAMGFPTRDPHGDPIPDRSGTLPQNGFGVALTDWEAEQTGRIVHLEDEPAIAFAQIIAEGIHLGQRVRVIENSPHRVAFTDGENEFRLAPAVAANVFLEPLPEIAAQPEGILSLAALSHNQAAEIIGLDDACQGFTRRRFLDLGMTPGTQIAPELQNAIGDPRAYRVRGTLIALRKEQAGMIWVKPLSQSKLETIQ
jgi:DtxR family Mn-dependent transcriptional regulator